MKAVKLSIENTIIALKGQVFDYSYFLRMCIAGLIHDGFAYLELSEDKEWVSCLNRKTSTWVQYNVYERFSALS